MSNKALAALRAKKAAAAQGTANKAPTKPPVKIGKPKPAATVEEGTGEEEDADAEEAVVQKTTKRPVIKGKKPTSKVIEDEDLNDDDDADLDDDEDQDQDLTEQSDDDLPADDEDEGEDGDDVDPDDDDDADLDADDEDGDDEPEPAPVKSTKKPVTKKPAATTKTAAPKASKAKQEQPASKPAKTGGLFGSSSRPEPKERRVFSEGEHITREEVIRKFAESRGISQADAQRGFADIEAFMLEEIFPMFSVTFFGVKFRRTETGASYREGAGGLNVKTDGLTTEISPHIAVRATITIGKEKRKGKIIKGEFVPGQLDAKGKFVRDEE